MIQPGNERMCSRGFTVSNVSEVQPPSMDETSRAAVSGTSLSLVKMQLHVDTRDITTDNR